MTLIDPELPDARFIDPGFRRLEERIGKYMLKEGIQLPGFRDPFTREMVAYDLAWGIYHALRPENRSTKRFNEIGTFEPPFSDDPNYVALVNKVAEEAGLCGTDGQLTSEAVRLRGALQRFYDTKDPD